MKYQNSFYYLSLLLFFTLSISSQNVFAQCQTGPASVACSGVGEVVSLKGAPGSSPILQITNQGIPATNLGIYATTSPATYVSDWDQGQSGYFAFSSGALNFSETKSLLEDYGYNQLGNNEVVIYGPDSEVKDASTLLSFWSEVGSIVVTTVGSVDNHDESHSADFITYTDVITLAQGSIFSIKYDEAGSDGCQDYQYKITFTW